MKYVIKYSNSFKKDLKLLIKRGYDIIPLLNIINRIANDEVLESIYDDHPLKGNLKEYRCCHITSDWLLFYKKNKKDLILIMSRTGTHSDLYNM